MQTRAGELYVSLLKLPPFVVIALLWVAGAVLEVAGIVALYEAGSMLVRVLEAVL